MASQSPSSSPRAGGGQFAPTRWTLVLDAAGPEAGSQADRALEELCELYWQPLYVFARRDGSGPEEAEDLTQAFFLKLIEKKSFAAARRERGRFRSFLLAAFKHFIADEWRRKLAQKRGGGRVVSIDAQSAEARHQMEPADRSTPEKIFARQWALQTLEAAVAGLRAEYEAAGKEAIFEALRGSLSGEMKTAPYAEIAARLGTSEGAIRTAAHRLRKRYRERLRAEVAQTVARPEDVEAELHDLFDALAG